jgi:hypothetical protein
MERAPSRLEDKKPWILVLIGATPEGRKGPAGFTDGSRESTQDWRDGAGSMRGRRWLDRHNQLPKLVLGVTLHNGIEVIAKPTACLLYRWRRSYPTWQCDNRH